MTITKPESIHQARHWDAAKSFYLRAGLCNGCAARLAWGTQQGFRNVQPPCTDCLPIILSFPRDEVGEWRAVPRPLWREWLDVNGPDLAPVFLAPPENAPHQLHPEHAGGVSLTTGTTPKRHVLPILTAA